MTTDLLPCNTDDVFTDATCCSSDDTISCCQGNEEVDHRKLRPRKSNDLVLASDITRKIRSVSRKLHRSVDDEVFLEQHKDLVKVVADRKSAYDKLKERVKEVEDDEGVLRHKVQQLAQLLRTSRHVVLYTGAGISTSANIPDYRGANGVWTRLNAGQDVMMGSNPSSATPTITHMAISALVAKDMVKYVVSQNCDGLHIRSSVPVDRLAELHGNMYAEICTSCGKSFYRVFDVTECTRLRRHDTKRHCDVCACPLRDTIVHFGEHSASRWPHNWIDAERNAEESDLIVCLGSSLKVLRSYKKLWLTDRKKSLRPKLCIVNIQWTPKDSQADLKINGRTDAVMGMLMEILSVDVGKYSCDLDPLFKLATPLLREQRESYSTRCVKIPEQYKAKFAEESRKHDERVQLSLDSNPLDGASATLKSGEEQIKFENEEPADQQMQSSSVASDVNTDVPAWFGKGCSKLIRRRGKVKRRRTTT